MWRAIATSRSLMRTLVIVVLEELRRRLSYLPECDGQTDLQAFLVQRAMQALHIRIFIWAPRRADVGVNAQAEQEPTECGGEMPQAMTANQPAITIKRHKTWASILGQEADYPLQSGLCMKIRPSFGHEPGGGSGIDKIENLHHMLLFAIKIRRHTGRILEIELNLFHGIGTILWSMRAMRCIQDTSELSQDTPD